MIQGRLLIVDDNESAIRALRLFLKKEFSEVKGITNPKLLPGELERGHYQLVLLDMNFRAGEQTGREGLFWLREIKKMHPVTEVVMITAYGDVDLAVEALKEGAADFVQKPWENEKMLATLRAAYHLGKSRAEVEKLRDQKEVLSTEIMRRHELIMGASPSMLRLIQTVHKVAPTDANILITGENGTGKEVLAREIHRLSERSAEMMVTVDMGTIPGTLFESELFGHRKGAFTDAQEDRTGKFQVAHRGTLFLDEIANLPLAAQSKLLGVLQNRQVSPLGSDAPVDIDVRLIAATNAKLNELVAEGSFREDLLYRLNTIHLEVPPLRERSGDLPALAAYFLRRFASRYRKDGLQMDPAVPERLKQYAWPGNIRELEHTIERSVIMSDGKTLRPADILFTPTPKAATAMPDTLEEMERLMVRNALNNCGGNISTAAAQLGITRQTLYNKCRKYGI